MTEVLFNNIKEFKKCMKTITEEEGLLSKRDYILHDNFNNAILNQCKYIFFSHSTIIFVLERNLKHLFFFLRMTGEYLIRCG